MRKSSALLAAVALTVGVIAGVTATQATSPTTAPPPAAVLPLAQMAHLYGDQFDRPRPPSEQSAAERVQWVTGDLAVAGRTPMDWVGESRRLLAPAAAEAAAPGRRLEAEVTRLYDLLDLEVDGAVVDSVAVQAGALDPDVRTALAEVLGAVNDAYGPQLALAESVMAREAQGFDPATPLVRDAERAALLDRQRTLLDAVERFRVSTGPALAATASTSAPLFSDPEGLVVLGSTGDDIHGRSGAVPDPVLLIDPAGSDTYTNSAGGACPADVDGPTSVFGGRWMECNGLAISVVADLGDGTSAPSNDSYLYDGPVAAVQGAGGPGGLGVLVDIGGSDTYDAAMTRTNTNPFTPITYYFDGGAQGFGYAGAGALVDGTGDDTYHLHMHSSNGRNQWQFGHGFGAAGGVGFAVDGSGSDSWESLVSAGNGGGFQGVYTDGTGFYGGVGVLADLGGGNDTYDASLSARTVDYYAQGFGAFGGLGVLYEEGGHDSYTAFEEASDPWIDPLLNCAFGTASFGGVGVMIDTAGDDVYRAEIRSPYDASLMAFGAGGPGVAYGVFADLAGDDRYEMVAVAGGESMVAGHGRYHPEEGGGDLINAPFGTNSFGTFLDAGGNDVYSKDGSNNGVWLFGADVETGLAL